jgi:hypothetical protein
MPSPFGAPRHAGREPRVRKHATHRWAVPVVGLAVASVAVLGLAGAAGRVPGLSSSDVAIGAVSTPNLSSGLPSLPFTGVTPPVYAKNGGQVTSVKGATTVNQDIQIQLAPDSVNNVKVHGQQVGTTTAYIFPVSPPGSAHQFGEFDPVNVSTLAFGSIPTTLTLNARNHFTPDNLPTYIFYQQKAIVNTQAGTQVAVPGGDPSLHGQLDISISNVKIDGVPVDVGSCHTATPATLEAHAKLFKFVFGQRPPPPVGNEEPQFTVYGGGQLRGSLTIPAFTGCQNGSDNLDALFTSLVSGPENIVNLTATGVGSFGLCTDPNNVSVSCGTLTPLPLPTNTQVH